PLPELPVQYSDYVMWQRERVLGGTLEAQLNYWKEQLKALPPPLDFSMAKKRAKEHNYQGGTFSFVLEAGLIDRLEQLSRMQGVTLFMTLLSGFELLLHGYTGEKD